MRSAIAHGTGRFVAAHTGYIVAEVVMVTAISKSIVTGTAMAKVVVMVMMVVMMVWMIPIVVVPTPVPAVPIIGTVPVVVIIPP